MGTIIRMTSKELLDDFIKKYPHKDYNFILISDDIKTDNKYKNVYQLRDLLPPTKALAYMINGGEWDKYYKKYLEHLNTPKSLLYITTMIKLAIVDDTNVIMVCSKAESELKYLKLLSKFIERYFHVKIYSYKEYNKKPKDCKSAPDKKKTIKVVNRAIKKLGNMDVFKATEAEVKAMKKLEGMSKKKLLKFAKENDIKIGKKADKDKILMVIKERIFLP